MDGKDVSIVTGASRGIGKSIALRLAAEGHNLAVFGRNTEALDRTCSELRKLGAETISFNGDVADDIFVSRAVKEAEGKFGKIDHLINNAGTSVFKKVTDAGLDELKKQIEANLYGIFNFTKAVLPGMIEREKGSVINIISLAGKNAFVTGSMYSASKHAALGFTKSLMLEVREYNIRVAAICPGSVDTEFFDGSSMNPNRDKILKPEDIAAAVISVMNMPPRALISEIDIRPTNPK